MNDVAQAAVPVPTTAGKFGKKEGTNESNPFGFDESDETHYWCVFLTFHNRLRRHGLSSFNSPIHILAIFLHKQIQGTARFGGSIEK